MNKHPFFQLSAKIKFILAAVVVAIILCWLNREVFTAATFVESMIFVAGICFLFFKYTVSQIISRYQDAGYQPTKAKKRWDHFFVMSAVHFVLPICTSLVYASSVLLLFKYLPLFNLKTMARWVYEISEFNKSFIKYPLWVAGAFVAILTLCDYVSEQFFKRYKKGVKKVTAPLKIVAVLLLFIVVDTGIEQKTIRFAIHESPVKVVDPKSISFNASTEQQEKVAEAADAFVDVVLNDIPVEEEENEAEAEEWDDSFPDDDEDDRPADKAKKGGGRVLAGLLARTSLMTENGGQATKAITHFTSTGYSTDEAAQLQSIFGDGNTKITPAAGSAPAGPRGPNPDFKPTNLHGAVYTKPESQWDEVIRILNDERTSINLEKKKSLARTIAGDYFKEFLGKTWLFETLPAKVRFPGLLNYGLFKNNVFDRLQEELTNSFFYLANMKEASAAKIRSLVRTTRQTIKGQFVACHGYLKSRAALVKRFYKDVHDKLVSNKIAQADALYPTTDLDYEKGLEKKISYLADGKSESALERARSYYREEILKQKPDITPDDLEYNINRNVARYEEFVMNDINESQAALNEKKYRDFDFIKNWQTSGGIFFGQGLNGRLPAGPTAAYYPALPQQPLATNPAKLWVERGKDGKPRLVIQSNGGRFREAEALDSALFMAAYRFVYEPGTYPSLIDIFYEEQNGLPTNKEIPAYHKSFVHNRELKTLFYEADKFTFRALDREIRSPLLDNLLQNPRASYQAARRNIATAPRYSRLYDNSHLICVGPNRTFSIHSDLEFSVVQTRPKDEWGSTGKYKELTDISYGFNLHKLELVKAFPYLQRLYRFAGYQALLRNVPLNKIDLYGLLFQ